MIRPEALRKRREKPLKKKVEKKEEEKKEEVEAEKKEGEVKEGEEKKEGDEKGEKKEEESVELELEESEYPTINERLAIDNRRRGTSSIVIKDSIRPDHGIYMVKVENDHGIASATCEVNVLGENWVYVPFLKIFHNHISPWGITFPLGCSGSAREGL